MWQAVRWSLVAILGIAAPVVWAADQQSGNVTPQGPGPTYDAGAAPYEATGYQPIPNSMLPAGLDQPAQQLQPGQPAPGPTPTNLGGPVLQPTGPYTLGRNDMVSVAVQGQPDFSGTYAIDYNGKIQYGFLGDISADGLTKEELAQVLAENLKKYVRVPQVTVTIAGFNSKAIYILGEVARPGKYAMRGDSIAIRDALIASGLMTSGAAINRVHVIKADPNDPTYRVLNLKPVLYKGKMKNNINLVNGDIVIVPSTVWSSIGGFISTLTNPASKARSLAWLGSI